jgi:putative iron-dependent peroxidase
VLSADAFIFRSMTHPQPGILAPLPNHTRWLLFDRSGDTDPRAALKALAALPHDEGLVTGIGAAVTEALGVKVPGLKPFPALRHEAIEVPSTQAALACWLRGGDPGELLHRGREVTRVLAGAFTLREHIDTFMYADSRDLSGYIDGTENPTDDAAVAAAIASESVPGSSFLAVQRWRHDLDRFQSFSRDEQDATFGRRHSDNQEIDDAPESAHVKRTAQESFDPEAFIVRRSMPWADGNGEGLVFVAFGHSFDAFETLLRHMVGLDDGITDALFRFTTPVSGSYFWCPPRSSEGTLDVAALGV